MAGLNKDFNRLPEDSGSYVLNLVERCRTGYETPRKMPYEVRLNDLVRLTNLGFLEVKFYADEGGVLRRWPDSKNPVYLIERETDEQILGINDITYNPEFLFEGYFSKEGRENKSLLFGNTNVGYPYYMPLDILAKKMGINKRLVQARLEKLGFVADLGCEFTSRDEEMIFLYTGPEEYLSPVPGVEKPLKIRKTPKKPIHKRKQEIFSDLEGMKLTKEEEEGLLKELDKLRPKTRADCRYNSMRPCPFLSCKYNLLVKEVTKKGEIKLESPEVGMFKRWDTCVLDVAERGKLTLEEVGKILLLTRERVRQLENKGIRKLRHPKRARMLEPVNGGYLKSEREETTGRRGLGASMNNL